LYSFDSNPSEGPAEKKQRRTQSVLVEQPSEDGKILIDNVSDETMSMDEVNHYDQFKFN
jgi:hypothetical protein